MNGSETKYAAAPRWVDAVLRLLTGRRWESVSGDLLEHHRKLVSPPVTPAADRRWWLWQLISYVTPLHFGLAAGAAAAVAIVVSNVILPALGVQGEEPPGLEAILMALGFGGSILFWVAAGYLGERRTHSLRSAITSGALVTLLQMSMVMLTFLLVNNLFLGIVSRQPDKLWGFEHSDSASVRSYVNQAAFRGFYLVLPIFVAAGALCGTLGGTLAARSARSAATK